MIPVLINAMRNLGLVVADDGSGRPAVDLMDRLWAIDTVDHVDVDSLNGDAGRLRSVLRLGGVYERRHAVADEQRAADDALALSLTLPMTGILGLRDRPLVQSPVTARASLDVVYLDAAGTEERRAAVMADARTLLTATNTGLSTGWAGIDGVQLARVVARPLDATRLVASFELDVVVRPGAGGGWGGARGVIEALADAVGWGLLDDTGAPEATVGRVGKSRLGVVRLVEFAGALFEHLSDDGWITVDLDFDLISEAP